MSLVLPLFHSKGQAAQQPLDGTPIVHANDIDNLPSTQTFRRI